MKNILTLLLVIYIGNVSAQTTTQSTNPQTPKDPVASVAGLSGGKISAAVFKAAKKIEVKGSDTSAVVTTYTVYFERKGFETAPGVLVDMRGSIFSKDVDRLFDKCGPGTIVTFDDIKVISGGVIKKVPTLVFTLY